MKYRNISKTMILIQNWSTKVNKHFSLFSNNFFLDSWCIRALYTTYWNTLLLEQFFFSNEEKIKDPSACPPLQNPPTSSSQQQEAYQPQRKPDPQTIAAECFPFYSYINCYTIILYLNKMVFSFLSFTLEHQHYYIQRCKKMEKWSYTWRNT